MSGRWEGRQGETYPGQRVLSLGILLFLARAEGPEVQTPFWRM